MKKFLCFALAAALAITPVALFADEYSNGENGNDYAVYESYDANDYDANDYDLNDDDSDNYDANDYDANDNGYLDIVAITMPTLPRWTFGMGDSLSEQGENGWYIMYDDGALAVYEDGVWLSYTVDSPYWLVNATEGVVAPGGSYVLIEWEAPESGIFALTGNVQVNDIGFSIRYIRYMDGNGGVVWLVSSEESYELHYELELEAGDIVWFLTHAEEDAIDAYANWSIVFTLLEEVVIEDENDVYEENDANEEYVDEEAEDLLAGLALRDVNGNPFVWFREIATAFDVTNLGFNSAAGVVYYNDSSFNVLEIGGFNDNGRIYVPLAFALEILG